MKRELMYNVACRLFVAYLRGAVKAAIALLLMTVFVVGSYILIAAVFMPDAAISVRAHGVLVSLGMIFGYLVVFGGMLTIAVIAVALPLALWTSGAVAVWLGVRDLDRINFTAQTPRHVATTANLLILPMVISVLYILALPAPMGGALVLIWGIAITSAINAHASADTAVHWLDQHPIMKRKRKQMPRGDYASAL